jgi:hypothetical protein
VGDVASAVENVSAAYSDTTVAPHEYFDQTPRVSAALPPPAANLTPSGLALLHRDIGLFPESLLMCADYVVGYAVYSVNHRAKLIGAELFFLHQRLGHGFDVGPVLLHLAGAGFLAVDRERILHLGIAANPVKDHFDVLSVIAFMPPPDTLACVFCLCDTAAVSGNDLFSRPDSLAFFLPECLRADKPPGRAAGSGLAQIFLPGQNADPGDRHMLKKVEDRLAGLVVGHLPILGSIAAPVWFSGIPGLSLSHSSMPPFATTLSNVASLQLFK